MSYSQASSPTQGETAPPATEEAPENQDTQFAAKLLSTNVAESLEEEELAKIGVAAKRGFDTDEASRKEWVAETKEWINLAKQLREKKAYPWPNASNIKYPLISIASLQFSARAYPSLLPSDGNVVNARIIGKDPSGEKASKGTRISKFMSWQLLYDMARWEEDFDRMLVMLSVCGLMFRKTFFDKGRDKVVSELVYPENFVIDYDATDIESAERYSEIIFRSERKVKEKIKLGDYLDVDLGPPPAKEGTTDSVTPYKLIEQATWLDLDNDDVMEPYTVLFHYESAKVLRISPRFRKEDIKTNEKGEIVCFKDQCHYTKYGFIPNPDGSFYDLGFGYLLGPINEAVNTLINQLTDSGTLANLQAGFVGKGLRIKMGETPLRPGEWRAVNATGDDIKKQFMPLPAKEPSSVLFQLLGMLITSGKELASVAEIFTGKMPGQNTPATTTMATIEQGMKVFTAIYKRIYRSLEKELKKIFYLNGYYLDKKTYIDVLDEPVGPEDFDSSTHDVCPSADPQASSQSEKMMKAQALLELLPLGMLDPMEVIKRVLQAQEQPNWEALIPGMVETGQPIPKQQPPDPKQQEMQMKMQAEAQKSELKQRESQQKMAMEQQSHEAQLAFEDQKNRQELQSSAVQGQLDSAIAQHKQQIFMREAQNKMAVSDAQHQQEMKQVQEGASK